MTLLEHVYHSNRSWSTKPVDHALPKKQCSKCGLLKNKEDFYLKKDKKRRLAICKKCHTNETSKARKKKYYEWYMVYSAKHRAAKKGLVFDITPEDIVIPEVCPLTGIEIKPGIGKIHPNSPSLDRFDNTKGYTKDNIWVISNLANAMKHSANLEQWKTFCTNSLKILSTYDS